MWKMPDKIYDFAGAGKALSLFPGVPAAPQALLNMFFHGHVPGEKHPDPRAFPQKCRETRPAGRNQFVEEAHAIGVGF